jgi:hypothetical protein
LSDSLEILPNSSKKNVQNDGEFKQNGKLCLNDVMLEAKLKTSKNIENGIKREETAVPGNYYVDIP